MDSASRRKTGSLTSRIVRVTVAIGVLMVLAAFVVTFISSYRLAAASARGRQIDYLQLALSEIDSHVTASSLVVRRAAFAVGQVPVTEVGSRLLASQYVGASELIDRLVLSSQSGKVVAAYPGWSGPVPPVGVEQATRLEVGEDAFVWDVSVAGETPTLWFVERIVLQDGTQRLVMARVRTSFMKAIVTRLSSRRDSRSAAIIDDGRVLVSGTGGPELLGRTASWEHPTAETPGAVSVRAAAVGTMRGYWASIATLPNTAWRVVIVEPESAVVTTSLRATAPTALVLVFGGLVGILMSWLISRRLVYPLRELEAASLKAAAGAYVEPLRADRDDEVGRLADAFNAVGLRLNALHDVSLLLAGASSLEQVLAATLRAVEHLVAPASAAVYLHDGSGRMRLASASEELSPPRGPLAPERGGIFELAASARVATALNVADLPGDWKLDSETAQVLVAPLLTSTETAGLIIAVRSQPPVFTVAEAEMLTTFGPQAATAVGKAVLFARETESRRTAEALRDVAAALVQPVGLSEALEAVRERVQRALAGRAASFSFEDREALGVRPSSDARLEADTMSLAERAVQAETVSVVVNRGEGPEAEALLDRLGVDEVLLARAAPGTGYEAALVVAGAEDAFSEQDLRLVDGVAKMVTIALDNAYSAERSHARATNLEKIFRISQAVGSSLQLNVVLNRVLDVVQMIFAADAVSLMIYDVDRRMVATSMARGSISAEILHLEVAPDEDLPGRVFARRQPVMLDDTSKSRLPLAVAAGRLGLKTLMAVPLLARGASIGVLNVFARVETAFDEEDMWLLQTFASQAALAIDTARLYGREHDTAKALQQSILPQRPPVFEEIETETTYEPAGHDSEIGGDYYDLFRAPDGSIVIAIADVCGKGVDAATKTSMIKYSIQALTAAGLGPGQCLSEINNLIVAKGDPGDILTAWLGFLNAKNGVLRWANGGHPPALLLRGGSQEVVRLATSGPLLGAIPEVVFQESEICIASGDSLLLYTDGVTEARSGNKFFGEGRLQRCLRYGGTPEAITRNVLGAVRRFAAGGLRDDVAMVVVSMKSGLGECVEPSPEDETARQGA